MNNIKKNIINYSVLFIITVIILQLCFRVTNVDLFNPTAYVGDGAFLYVIVNSILSGLTPLFGVPENIYLGAPHMFSVGDFPVFDMNFMFIIMKGIYLFCRDTACTIYIYYFLTYIAISFTSFYVFKKFRINTLLSISMSLLFSFAPYHFYRGMEHITYSSYYFVPFMMLIVFWMWSKKPLFFKYSDNKWKLDLKNKKSIFAICTLILAGISNIYFDFFWMFFLTTAILSAWFYRKNIYQVYSYLILIISNFFVIVLNACPYLIYKIQNGANPGVAHRAFFEAELYGLKIIQMLLPGDGHFLLYRWKTQYNKNPILINENTTATLGIIALIGFLFVMFYFLFIRGKKFNIFNKCGLLLTSGILLATVGGVSSFISFAIFTEIRCYNRISIFLSFICLLVFAFIMQKCLKYIKNKHIITLIFIIITAIGIRDSLPRHFAYNRDLYKIQRQHYNQDKDFIGQLEKLNKPNATIFQLPYVPFPEYPPVGEMVDYEQFKPYILSSGKLKYSYGAVRGREAANWNEETAKLPAKDMIKRLKGKGFTGILIAKKGYMPTPYPNGITMDDSILKELPKYLKTSKIENNEYIYYSLK